MKNMLFWTGTVKKLLLNSFIFILVGFSLYSYEIQDIFAGKLGKRLEVQKLKFKNVTDIFVTSVSFNEKWFGVSTLYQGIVAVNLKTGEEKSLTIRDGLVSNSIRKIYLLGDSNYLAGFYVKKEGGFFIFNLKTAKVITYSQLNFLDSSRVLDLIYIDGYLYILTDKKSLFVLNFLTGDKEKLLTLDNVNISRILLMNLNKKLILAIIEKNKISVAEVVANKLKVMGTFDLKEKTLGWKWKKVNDHLYLWGTNQKFTKNYLFYLDSKGKFLNYSNSISWDGLGITALIEWYKRVIFVPFEKIPFFKVFLSKKSYDLEIKSIPWTNILVEDLISLKNGILITTSSDIYFVPKQLLFTLFEKALKQKK